jgi:hypothetical protein
MVRQTILSVFLSRLNFTPKRVQLLFNRYGNYHRFDPLVVVRVHRTVPIAMA